MSLRSEVIRIMNELLGNSKKISELTSLPTNIENTDLIEVVRSGENYKATGAQLPSGGGGAVSSVNGDTGAVVVDLESVLGQGSTASITEELNVTVDVDGITTTIIANGDGIVTNVTDGVDQMGIEHAYNSIGIGNGSNGINISAAGVTTQTPALNDDSTKIATTAFVRDEIASRSPKVIQVAASDETTALTTGTGKITFRMPYAMTLTAVRASLSTAQTSGSIFTVDINEAGSTILSTKITIDNAEKTSTTAATPPVISDTSLADDAEITIDIDQIGDSTAKGLKVTLIGV